MVFTDMEVSNPYRVALNSSSSPPTTRTLRPPTAWHASVSRRWRFSFFDGSKGPPLSSVITGYITEISVYCS